MVFFKKKRDAIVKIEYKASPDEDRLYEDEVQKATEILSGWYPKYVIVALHKKEWSVHDKCSKIEVFVEDLPVHTNTWLKEGFFSTAPPEKHAFVKRIIEGAIVGKIPEQDASDYKKAIKIARAKTEKDGLDEANDIALAMKDKRLEDEARNREERLAKLRAVKAREAEEESILRKQGSNQGLEDRASEPATPRTSEPSTPKFGKLKKSKTKNLDKETPKETPKQQDKAKAKTKAKAKSKVESKSDSDAVLSSPADSIEAQAVESDVKIAGDPGPCTEEANVTSTSDAAPPPVISSDVREKEDEVQANIHNEAESSMADRVTQHSVGQKGSADFATSAAAEPTSERRLEEAPKPAAPMRVPNSMPEDGSFRLDGILTYLGLVCCRSPPSKFEDAVGDFPPGFAEDTDHILGA